MKRRIWFSFWVLCAMLLFGGTVRKAEASQETRVEEAKNAIVKIQTVLKSYEGKGYRVKASCGFLICNEEGKVYIITTNSGVTITSQEKKAIYKKYKLDAGSQLNTEIQIVIEGDVTSEATVKASSRKDDFCVLEANDVLEKRGTLCVQDTEEAVVGESVYALGLKGESMKSSAYEQADVEIHAGEIEDTSAAVEGNTYIQHSAVVDAGQSGGALLNADGYVIGVSNAGIVNETLKTCYAVPIAKIQAVLDNYGITYESREKMEAADRFAKIYAACSRLCKSKKYTNASKEALQTALEEAGSLIQEEEISAEGINEAQKLLEKGKKQLKPKMGRLRIVQCVLGAVLVLLGAHLLWVLVRYRRIGAGKSEKTDKGHTKRGSDHNLREEEGLDVNTAPADRSEDAGRAVQKRKERPVFFGESDAAEDRLLSDFESEETVKLRRDTDNIPPLQQYTSVDGRFRKDGASLRNVMTEVQKYVSKEVFTLGKSEEADFQLSNKAVSRKHAVIRWKEGKYCIQDLDSANGTFVNGKTVADSVELKSHDVITLADEEIEFILKDGEVQI